MMTALDSEVLAALKVRNPDRWKETVYISLTLGDRPSTVAELAETVDNAVADVIAGNGRDVDLST